MAKRWIIAPTHPDSAEAAQSLRVSAIIAQVLANRQLSRAEDSLAFLNPQLKDLHPPESLSGIPRAADILLEAARTGAKIVLYGDYDVDGVTGVAILWHVLREAGVDVAFYVPHRLEEGYGLNRDAVERLIADGANLIVTVDCGVTAVDVAEVVRKAGARLIITDHHTPQAELPEAEAIVHPGLSGYPNPHLSGAGVAFKLAWALAQRISGGEKVTPLLRERLSSLLPLAALGTIADVVPLIGENRVIARHGLNALPKTTLPGLRALLEIAGLLGEKVSGYDVGFKLAPRLNAAGRMGHARLAVELMTRADDRRAREIALYLEEHNKARQSTERQITKHANELIEKHRLAGDARRAIVLSSDKWHAGVIGIVAARIVDRYHRPAVMISLTSGDGQGSARSIANFDLAAAFGACGEHLISSGGHAMAAGLKIKSRNIDAFTEQFVALANEQLTGDDLVPKLRLDAEISLSDLTLPTVEAIQALGPFGMGNPKPRFATRMVELADEPRTVGQRGDHLQCTFRENGATLRAIGFGLGEHIEDLKQHRRCRVAFEPLINDFNGRRTAEMQIVDLQFGR